MDGVYFRWKDKRDDRLNIGLIAQDVEKLFPEIVYTNEEGYKSVNYAGLVAPLIEATKEQQALIEANKFEIDENGKVIKSNTDRIEKLEREVQELKQELNILRNK